MNLVGVSEEGAHLIMRDENLWILDSGARYGSELAGEAGVRQWEDVADLAELATNYIDRSSPAATQLIGDAALRRARARLEAAGEE